MFASNGAQEISRYRLGSKGFRTTGPNKHLMIRGSQALKLPVGDVPDWEVDGSDSEHSDLKSPAERRAYIHRSMCDPA